MFLSSCYTECIRWLFLDKDYYFFILIHVMILESDRGLNLDLWVVPLIAVQLLTWTEIGICLSVSSYKALGLHTGPFSL